MPTNTRRLLLGIGAVGAAYLFVRSRVSELGGGVGSGGGNSDTGVIANPDRHAGVDLETGFPGTDGFQDSDVSSGESNDQTTADPGDTYNMYYFDPSTSASDESGSSDPAPFEPIENPDQHAGVDLETGFPDRSSNDSSSSSSSSSSDSSSSSQSGDTPNADRRDGVDLETGFPSTSGDDSADPSDSSDDDDDTSNGVDLSIGFGGYSG